MRGESQTRVAVILAGGRSRRMGGVDKATIELGGVRLIDRVIARLSPQVDEILIAGPYDYGTGVTLIVDRKDGPKGPAAALWSTVHWLSQKRPNVLGFVTAPVDGPFLPADLYARLSAAAGGAVACNEDGAHPTFAFWNVAVLKQALDDLKRRGDMALHDIATQCEARRISFVGEMDLMNINTREDAAAAESVLKA